MRKKLDFPRGSIYFSIITISKYSGSKYLLSEFFPPPIPAEAIP